MLKILHGTNVVGFGLNKPNMSTKIKRSFDPSFQEENFELSPDSVESKMHYTLKMVLILYKLAFPLPVTRENLKKLL